MNDVFEIQDAIDVLIGTKTKLIRKKRNESDKKKDLFIAIIHQIEIIQNRNRLIYADFKLNLSEYDEPYNQVIDNLIYYTFNKDAADLIMFYCYDRIDINGNVTPIIGYDGQELFFDTPEQLWVYILTLNK
jgi:hypothetical protein